MHFCCVLAVYLSAESRATVFLYYIVVHINSSTEVDSINGNVIENDEDSVDSDEDSGVLLKNCNKVKGIFTFLLFLLLLLL